MNTFVAGLPTSGSARRRERISSACSTLISDVGIRAIIIHQKRRNRFLLRALLARGVSRRAATGTAWSRRGTWHRSNRPGMTRAYPQPLVSGTTVFLVRCVAALTRCATGLGFNFLCLTMKDSFQRAGCEAHKSGSVRGVVDQSFSSLSSGFRGIPSSSEVFFWISNIVSTRARRRWSRAFSRSSSLTRGSSAFAFRPRFLDVIPTLVAAEELAGRIGQTAEACEALGCGSFHVVSQAPAGDAQTEASSSAAPSSRRN